jgi:hypothetical protein
VVHVQEGDEAVGLRAARMARRPEPPHATGRTSCSAGVAPSVVQTVQNQAGRSPLAACSARHCQPDSTL